ncbi:MAG: hypothetical protein ACO1OQ_06375 [Rufibacter sp.]
MKPRHFKFTLLLAALFSSFAGVRGQALSPETPDRKVSVHVNAQVEEIVNPVIAECVSKSLEKVECVASLKSLESLSALEKLNSLSSLQSLESLSSLESLESLASLGALAEVSQTGPNEPLLLHDEYVVQTPGAFAAEKSKNVSKTFKVTSADKLSIENQYGRVDVQTWNRNEIAVEVKIISRAQTESKAQEILDKISVDVDESGNLISFVTEREPMEIRSSSEKSFEINYLVKMPKGNALQVNNKYGAVQLPDFDGPTELNVRYGKLTTGRLNNRHNNININYSSGQCVLEYVRSGDLEVKYSNLQLNGGESIRAITAYSRVGIDKVGDLAIESRYDQSFNVGSANQVSGTGSYSAFSIANLGESVGMNVKYSKVDIGNIGANFKKVDLIGGYTAIKLGFNENSAFNFDINTSYCSNPKFNSGLVNFSFKEVKNTTATYRGKYGKSNAKGVVNVTNKYGSIALN